MEFKIGKYQAISLILIVMVNKILLNIPKEIIKQSQTGAAINVIFTCILALLITLFICSLVKKFPDEDIIDISKFVGKKPLQVLLGIAYILLFSTIIITVIYEFTNLLQVIYFPTTSVYLLLLSFLIPMAVASKTGFKAILKTNSIITIFILLSLIVIFLGTIANLKITRIYPILGTNINNTFIKGSSNIFSYGGLIYLFFLSPLLKNKKDFKKIAIISILISGLFLLFTITILLTIFPFITHSEEILSMYLLTRCIEFGEFIQRTDAIFIFLWIISAFSYLSISLNFINIIFEKLTNCNKSKSYSYSFLGIFFAIIILFQNQSLFKFLETSFYKYFILGLLFISLIILVIGNIKKKGNSI